jgi:hypothetical protein
MTWTTACMQSTFTFVPGPLLELESVLPSSSSLLNSLTNSESRPSFLANLEIRKSEMTKRGRWWKEKAVEKKNEEKTNRPVCGEKKATPSKAAVYRNALLPITATKEAAGRACASITAKGGGASNAGGQICDQNRQRSSCKLRGISRRSHVQAMWRVEQPRAQLKKQVKDYKQFGGSSLFEKRMCKQFGGPRTTVKGYCHGNNSENMNPLFLIR